jgi:hypothetical protein
MKFIIGLMLLNLIPGISRACMITDQNHAPSGMTPASFRVGNTSKALLSDCLWPASSLGLQGSCLEAPDDPAAVQAHKADADLFDRYATPPLIERSKARGNNNGLIEESAPEVLLFIGAGCVVLGCKLKGSGRKALTRPSLEKEAPLPVSSFAKAPLQVE